MSVSECAAAFGFSRPTFYRVQAEFEAQGLPGLLPRQRGTGCLKKKTGRGRNSREANLNFCLD